MLTHIVMWKLKDHAEGKTKAENALWMKENLESLLGQVSELKSCTVGINSLADDDAFDAVLISTFDSAEDLQAYKVHPLHKAISQYCKKVREKRVVVDF